MSDLLSAEQLEEIKARADAPPVFTYGEIYNLRREVAALLQEVERLSADSKRFQFASDNYVATDFKHQISDSATEVVLMIHVPDATRVCGDFRRDIDAAMEAAHYLVAADFSLQEKQER